MAEDEGETTELGGGREERGEIEMLMHEGMVKQDEEEDPMSVDLFGPEMSSQPTGQHFGAENVIALLGGGASDDQHGLPWSDEPHDGIFEEFSPRDVRVQSPDELEQQEEMEISLESPEPRKSSAELVKEWFPNFSPDEIPRFTEIFGTQKAELTRPVFKTPKGTLLSALF